MSEIKVSTAGEVLERFRVDVVADLKRRGFKVPSEAEVSGNYHAAFVAWQRLQHRGVSTARRTVTESPELLRRELEPWIRDALRAIRAEFERGDDLTHRLSRLFYKSGFNDFLFNNFGMHHLHLGAPGAGVDTTKMHPMSGGAPELLFALITPTEAYFLDVQDHNVFERADLTKSLALVALRNRPKLFEQYIPPGVVGVDQTFEDAFLLAKAGVATVYELDGKFLMTGGTVLDGHSANGKRAPCTSIAVVTAADRVLTRIKDLVEYVRSNTNEVANVAESLGKPRPSVLQLEVVEAGSTVHLRETHTGLYFVNTGRQLGWRAEVEDQVAVGPGTPESSGAAE